MWGILSVLFYYTYLQLAKRAGFTKFRHTSLMHTFYNVSFKLVSFCVIILIVVFLFFSFLVEKSYSTC